MNAKTDKQQVIEAEDSIILVNYLVKNTIKHILVKNTIFLYY